MTLVLIMLALNVGFVLGCAWAGRGRSGVRERATDSADAWQHTLPAEDLPVPTPPYIWQEHGQWYTDKMPSLPPEFTRASRDSIWQRIRDKIAVNRLIGSL
jgi:hypothetical protein